MITSNTASYTPVSIQLPLTVLGLEIIVPFQCVSFTYIGWCNLKCYLLIRLKNTMQFGMIVSVYGVCLYVFLLTYYSWYWYGSGLLANVTKKRLSWFIIGTLQNLSLLGHLLSAQFSTGFSRVTDCISFSDILNVSMVLYVMLEYTANYLLRTTNGVICMDLSVLST